MIRWRYGFTLQAIAHAIAVWGHDKLAAVEAFHRGW
ncbi:Uncharacterised protein [Vibrio cholerae]|nr:Uncharacterised protein [Vibrio cholerae]